MLYILIAIITILTSCYILTIRDDFYFIFKGRDGNFKFKKGLILFTSFNIKLIYIHFNGLFLTRASNGLLFTRYSNIEIKKINPFPNYPGCFTNNNIREIDGYILHIYKLYVMKIIDVNHKFMINKEDEDFVISCILEDRVIIDINHFLMKYRKYGLEMRINEVLFKKSFIEIYEKMKKIL